MTDYMLVIYSKEKDGEKLLQYFGDWLGVVSNVEAFKQRYGLEYPDAVWSAYDRRQRKWTKHYKEKVM